MTAARATTSGRLGAALCLFTIVACQGPPPTKAPADATTVIARWQGGEVRRGDIQQAIDSNLAAAPQPATSEVRRAIVRKIVERRVRTAMLQAEALAKGYAERPEVRVRQAAAEDRVLAEDLLAGEVAKVKAADALVVAEVDRRLAAAHPEETRKFSHIYLRAAASDAAARDAAVALMTKIQGELAAGKSFNQLAETYSSSVMARGGGRIDWTARAALQPAAGDAVFALAQEGDLSPVVTTPDGLHLFRLDGIRRASPVDAAAIRLAVRQELDAEAQNAAIRSRRQQALDAHAVELAADGRLAQLESAGGEGSSWVARWQDGGAQVMTAEVLRALHGRVLPTRQSMAVELRWVVENRLLAAARRAEGISPDLDTRVAEARRQVIIDSYRGDLMAALDTPPSDEEVTRYYRDHAASELFLRDFEVDVLFFPQAGDSVADVFAAGEEVVGALRGERRFDDLLDHPARPDARTCRAVHGVDVEALGSRSLRLRKALLNLAEGEVSPAVYLEQPVALAATCSLPGRGVAFVRLRAIGTLPLASARANILAALSKERVDAGVAAIQERLIAQSKLEILVPEG